jgi:hypothetical protein
VRISSTPLTFSFGWNVDRHAAAVVGDFQRAVLVQHHVDALGVAGERLVDRVIDDFVARWFGRLVSVYMPGRGAPDRAR